MATHPAANPLHPNELFGHVRDSDELHLPKFLTGEDAHGHVKIPQPFDTDTPIYRAKTGNALIDKVIEPFELKITKFMVIELTVAVLLCVIFIGLARVIRGGAVPRGRLWNFFEASLLFFRDNVARPAIGHHDADRFVPYIWTVFFFVLGCNLFGMIPWMGSPTGALAVTGALAFITFLVVIASGMMKLGGLGFWKAQVPHMDLSLSLGGINFEPLLKIFLMPMIFFIEVAGIIIKHAVLAVRLLANMMAGHVVLAVIVAFIGATWASSWVYAVAPASVLAAVALSMLELFVAFLQAYIFAFLSALFIGMAVHPH